MQAALPSPQPTRRLYVVATVHLDTQWRWTVEDTIRDFIPNTLKRNFELLEQYPFFVVSFEGAFRYMLMKEYYPDQFERLKTHVADGRWRLAGSMVDAPDVNIVSPESLIRHILYGNRFFTDEFGRQSRDLFLPDCFGFGAALPSIAAHCGLVGISGQKFGNWMAPASIPFEIGRWHGPDQAGVVAAIRPEGYGEGLAEDLSRAERFVERIDQTGKTSGAYVAMKYVGVGDRGGGLDDSSMKWLQESITGKGPIHVEVDGSDQLFCDLSKDQIGRLPIYQGELLLPTHGTGCLTSQAVLKRWNRQNELLAEAAEKAASIADWLGTLPYPIERFRQAWIRFLWHQMHDDLTGTSIPRAYEFSRNDQLLSLNQFARLLTESAGAVAESLDTRCEGQPVLVFNPLSIPRQDVVEVTLDSDFGETAGIRVVGPDGSESPAQLSTNHDGEKVALFLADVPALGFSVFDLRLGPLEVDATHTDLRVTPSGLENHRYRVMVDENGDIGSVYDKRIERELLSEPIGLELLRDRSARWPAWEILFKDITAPPADRVGGPVDIQVIETGPVRASLQVKRRSKRSTYIQLLRLSSAGAGDRLEIETKVNWRTKNRLLKAVFRLNSPNPEATYDLGLGQIRRGNNRREKYEVPAQQWADLSLPDGSLGVSILNDCKYGWDKPDDRTLRLSLLRSPRVVRKFRHQGKQDFGYHRFKLGLYGHGDGWTPASTCWQAARLNQPLIPFRTPSQPGVLGREFSFSDGLPGNASIKTIKKSEDGEGYVIRLQELDGLETTEASISFPSAIEKGSAINGAEEPIGKATTHGQTLNLDLGPFSIQAFQLGLATVDTGAAPPETRVVPIPFDHIATTRQGETSLVGFDGRGHSYPAELFPAALNIGGVDFRLGTTDLKEPNSLKCDGQAIPLPEGEFDSLHILATAIETNCRATVLMGDRPLEIEVPYFSGLLGYLPKNAADQVPLLDSKHNVAWVATHRHRSDGSDEPYVFCYLFESSLELELGCREIRLPRNPDIRIFSISLATGRIGRTSPATRFYG